MNTQPAQSAHHTRFAGAPSFIPAPSTAGTIPNFTESQFYKQETAWRDAYNARGRPLNSGGEQDARPDKTGMHSFSLNDSDGNGYTMDYDYDRSLHVTIFEANRPVFSETFPAKTYARAEEIEFMVLTARSVGQAILDDELEGGVRENFCDGWATLADRLDMDFALSDDNSNETVSCTLNVVSEDKQHYDTTLTFTMPSLNLWAATDHLTALC